MYIITGGAGFIGSVVAAALEQPDGNRNIVIVDKFGTSSKWRNVSKRNPLEIIRPDQLMDYLDDHEEAVEAVLHIGANADTTERDVDHLLENNVTYSIDLFNWCCAHNKRFIFASSAATYGDAEQGFKDSENMAYLNSLRPLNPYGWSKHMVDKHLVQCPHNGSHKHWVSLKFFNVYGPNEYHKGRMGSVIQHAYSQIVEEGVVRLFKSHRDDYEHGEQLRDFVYVKDVARIIWWFLQNPTVGGIYNIGTGQARTFNDLANSVFKAMQKKPKIEYIDMPADLRRKYQYFTEADMSKLQDTITANNTKPFQFTSLEDGITDYVQNYLMQEDPYL